MLYQVKNIDYKTDLLIFLRKITLTKAPITKSKLVRYAFAKFAAHKLIYIARAAFRSLT